MKYRKSNARRRPAATAADLMLAPAVMAVRLPILAAEATATNPFRTETTRAVAEKLGAAAEGLAAAQFTLLKSAWTFWPEVLSGRVPALVDGSAMRQAAEAALKPAGRRVKANYRRLSRS